MRETRMTVLTSELPLSARRLEGPKRVGSVNSLMQKAAVRLLDAVTVTNPSHC
jgi:hypothetical protein